MRRRARAWTGLLLALLVLAFAAPAAALPPALEAARRDGVVGEQADGYLGLVKGAPAEIKKAVDDVNAQRRAKYAEVAQQRGIDVGTFAAITGKKLVLESPAGTYVRGADGQWVVKR